MEIMEPLSGIRILDLTWVMAGPRATQLLAFLGAECIKVESQLSPDLFRTDSASLGNKRGIYLAFSSMNAGKLSIQLNLTHPGGVGLFRQLVTISDVVVDNFTPGTMAKFGLGYDDLKVFNPSIIVASLSSHGASGPERDYKGYAVQFGPLSGMSELVGYSDGPPEEIRSGADIRTGVWTAFAILAALNYRQKTGKGQFIDISARECLTCQIGDSLMEFTMNGRVPTRMGNRDSFMAPHNCYPCKGNDSWLSVAVGNDEEWTAFCKAIGSPTWSCESKFASQDSRWQNQDELDKYIATWTVNQVSSEAMHILQGAGIAAVPSFSNKDLSQDPHCKERNLFEEIEDPRMGKHAILSPPWKLSGTPAVIVRPAPGLGEHTEHVLCKLLGISVDEIRILEQEKAIY